MPEQHDDAIPPLDSLVLGQGSTSSQPLQHEPNSWAHAGPVNPALGAPIADQGAGLGVPGQDRYLDQNGPNGPGGVCASPPVADLAHPAPVSAPEPTIVTDTSALATPLIPDQPLPPGAPPALAAVMAPGLSPLSTDLSTGAHHEPSVRAHSEPQPSASNTSPTPGLMVNGSPAQPAPGPAPALPRDVGPLEKREGFHHPWKPQTPAQIAEFAALWHDPAHTVESIMARYKAGKRTVQRWREEFGLGPRDQAMKAGLRAKEIADAAQGLVARFGETADLANAMTRAEVVAGQVVDPQRFDPLKDPEIAGLLNDILAEARQMTGHSDLQPLQRKLARLAVVAQAKVPVRTWDGLGAVVEGLSRTLLYMRRVEAEVPSSGADPVLLRKEAAGQMMREMKSVLDPAEQAQLASLVKRAADRLMAKASDQARAAEAAS